MIHRFANYELDEDKAELRCGGVPVRLQPKPFELLQLLVRERQRVVSLDELYEALWPDTIVTPSSLTRAVSHARRAIGDTGRGQLIRSHARRGYRFCAEVEIAPGPAPRHAAAAEAPAPLPAANADPFVGRAAALERLMTAWDEAAAGRGSVAVVRGPAGIGKSRLTQEFADRARERGARVLVGRGRRGEGVPPLWIWAQVLRAVAHLPHLADALTPVAEQGDDFAPWLPELAGMIAEARSGSAGRDAARLPAEQRRFLLFEAVNRTLGECSRREPLLIVLEDLHWSRSSALGLFEHIAYEIGERRILLVATVRDEGEPDPALRHALAIIQRGRRPLEIELDGLSRAEVAELLGQAIGQRAPSELSSEVFARTEGVPLFVREAIRMLAARGDLAGATSLARRGLTLPIHAFELIHRSLEALPSEVLELVSAGAVLGRDFSVPLVASLVQRERAQVLEQIDRAVGGGVLAAAPERPGRFRFAHALFRDAAYDRLAASQCAQLHLRVAQRLEAQLDGDPDGVLPELAHHLHQSLAIGEPKRALEIAQRAAVHAHALGADDQAALHYEQALVALDQLEQPDPGARLSLLTELAEAHGFAGDRERRRTSAQQAMDLARTLGRGCEFARAAIAFCDISEWSPEDPEADRALRSALSMLGNEHPVERARVLIRLAYLVASDKRGEVEERGREALGLARESGDSDAIQEALFTLHYILAGPDRLAERAALATELGDLAPASGDRDPALVALLDSACDALAEGRRSLAADRRRRAGVICGQRPHAGLTWHMSVYDTGLALMEGRLDEGKALAQQAREIGDRISHPYAFACFNGHNAEALLWRGRPDEALRRIEPAIERSAGPYRWVRALAGRLHRALGNDSRARQLLESLAIDDFCEIPRDIRWLNTIVETAHLCAELGDAERARPLVALLEPAASLHGVFCIPINYGGPLAGGLAALEALLGQPASALAHARAAVESTAALGARPMEMRHRRDLAQLLEAEGAAPEAATERARADRIASQLGLVDGLRPNA